MDSDMKNCIRIVYAPDTQEYILEAFGNTGSHLGSRTFSTWNSLARLLSSSSLISEWLWLIASGEIFDLEAKLQLGKWPM